MTDPRCARPARIGCGHTRGRRVLRLGPHRVRPPHLRRAGGHPLRALISRLATTASRPTVRQLPAARRLPRSAADAATQDSLMELFLMIDAARGASAAMITAVIPRLAYARSDKGRLPHLARGAPGRRPDLDRRRGPGAHHEPHAAQEHGFFSVPVDHLAALGVLADHFRDRISAARRRLPRPRQRQGRRPVLPAARPAGRRGVEAPVGRRPRRHQLHRRRRRGQAGHRARRRDRHRRLNRRAVDRLAERGVTEVAIGCTQVVRRPGRRRLQGRPMIRGGDRRHGPPPLNSPEFGIRSVEAWPRRSVGSTRVGRSRACYGIDPTHAPPRQR